MVEHEINVLKNIAEIFNLVYIAAIFRKTTIHTVNVYVKFVNKIFHLAILVQFMFRIQLTEP